MEKEIKGTVQKFDFEGGFWGIVADDDYYPINFPEQLKFNNAKVQCTIVILEDVMTIVSWGLPCRIVSFSTYTTSTNTP